MAESHQQPFIPVLPHTSLAAINHGAHIKLYFQSESGAIHELSSTNDRVYVCNEVVLPKKLQGEKSPRMFTPLAACAFDEGHEVRLYYLDETAVIREVCWTQGHLGGAWYMGDLYIGAKGVQAAQYSDLAVVWRWGRFRVYYQTPKDNMIAEVRKNEDDLWVEGVTLNAAATPGTRLAATVKEGGEKEGELINVYYQDRTLHPCVVVITEKETMVDARRTSEIHLPHRAPLAALNLNMHYPNHNANTPTFSSSINIYTQLHDNLLGKLTRAVPAPTSHPGPSSLPTSPHSPEFEFDILSSASPLTSLAIISGVSVDDDWTDGLRVFFQYQDGRMARGGKDSAVVLGKKAWTEVGGWSVERRITPVWPRGGWEGNLEWEGVELELVRGGDGDGDGEGEGDE